MSASDYSIKNILINDEKVQAMINNFPATFDDTLEDEQINAILNVYELKLQDDQIRGPVRLKKISNTDFYLEIQCHQFPLKLVPKTDSLISYVKFKKGPFQRQYESSNDIFILSDVNVITLYFDDVGIGIKYTDTFRWKDENGISHSYLRNAGNFLKYSEDMNPSSIESQTALTYLNNYGIYEWNKYGVYKGNNFKKISGINYFPQEQTGTTQGFQNNGKLIDYFGLGTSDYAYLGLRRSEDLQYLDEGKTYVLVKIPTYTLDEEAETTMYHLGLKPINDDLNLQFFLYQKGFTMISMPNDFLEKHYFIASYENNSHVISTNIPTRGGESTPCSITFSKYPIINPSRMRSGYVNPFLNMSLNPDHYNSRNDYITFKAWVNEEDHDLYFYKGHAVTMDLEPKYNFAFHVQREVWHSQFPSDNEQYCKLNSKYENYTKILYAGVGNGQRRYDRMTLNIGSFGCHVKNNCIKIDFNSIRSYSKTCFTNTFTPNDISTNVKYDYCHYDYGIIDKLRDDSHIYQDKIIMSRNVEYWKAEDPAHFLDDYYNTELTIHTIYFDNYGIADQYNTKLIYDYIVFEPIKKINEV